MVILYDVAVSVCSNLSTKVESDRGGNRHYKGAERDGEGKFGTAGWFWKLIRSKSPVAPIIIALIFI